ncbi:MAG: hypothetical protein AAFX03_00780 [Pseudomonadota bacterium]
MLSRILKGSWRKTDTSAARQSSRSEENLVALAPKADAEAEPILDQEEMEIRAERAVNDLAPNHEAWLRGDVERLREAWECVAAGEAGARGRLFIASHNLNGMAETYGSPAIGRLTQSLCRLLKARQDDSVDPIAHLHVEACRSILAHGAQSASADTLAKTICHALEAQVDRMVAAAA